MYPTAVARTPLDINLNIGVDSPAEFLESLLEPCRSELSFPIVLRVKHQHANQPHAPRCCAHAASGHATAAPPTSVMNSLRAIITRSPHQRVRVTYQVG